MNGDEGVRSGADHHDVAVDVLMQTDGAVEEGISESKLHKHQKDGKSDACDRNKQSHSFAFELEPSEGNCEQHKGDALEVVNYSF